MNDVILIGSDSMGSHDQKLGGILLCNFLRILGEKDQLPKYIILWNSGVKIATNDTETADYLDKLQKRGIEILLCRTCVDYFDISDQVIVGKIDGMVRILDILANHQVLTI